MSIPPQTLADWDESWPQEHAQSRSCILDATQGRLTAVHPIGSTAVDGLPSQPIIDTLVVSPPGELLEETGWLLQGLNFRSLAQVSDPFSDVHRFVKPRAGSPTHQVFLTTDQSLFVESALGFRDWLIRNPTDAQRFSELKLYLRDLFENDADSYEAGKASFYRHIEARRLKALHTELI